MIWVAPFAMLTGTLSPRNRWRACIGPKGKKSQPAGTQPKVVADKGYGRHAMRPGRVDAGVPGPFRHRDPVRKRIAAIGGNRKLDVDQGRTGPEGFRPKVVEAAANL